MKPSEQIFLDQPFDGMEIADIEAIQLDAMKEGARRAADLAYNPGDSATWDERQPHAVRADILSASESWTTKDLQP